MRRPGGKRHPGNYRRQQDWQDRQSAFSHPESPSSSWELPDDRSAHGLRLTALSWRTRILPWSGLLPEFSFFHFFTVVSDSSFDAAAWLVVGHRRGIAEPFVAAATRIRVVQVVLPIRAPARRLLGHNGGAGGEVERDAIVLIRRDVSRVKVVAS